MMCAMFSPFSALRAAADYLRQHPEEIGLALRNAIGMRVGVPLAAFRWLAGVALEGKDVEGVEIKAVPPGLRLEGSFPLEKAWLRGGATLYVDRVALSATEMRVDLRLENVELVPLDDTKTQVTALLRAKALDLSRPGDLVHYLPDMPPMIVDPVGNRLGIDLMRIPKLAEDDRVRHAVGMLTSLITLDRMETEPDHFDLAFRPIPRGVSAVVEAVGDHVLAPAMGALKALLPGESADQLDQSFNRVVDVVAGADPGAPGSESTRAEA